jgi:hypothetical protein
MQQPTPNQPLARPNTNLSQEQKSPSRTFMRTLGVATLACLTMSWANAQDRDLEAPPVHSRAQEPQPTTQVDSSVEIPSVPVIEVVVVKTPDPTMDQLMQKFRDALAEPPLILAEHRSSSGMLEVITRSGRFCAKTSPGHVESGLGGDITLASPCVWF